MWIPTRFRVSIQYVLVDAGTTRTCVSTCARGAGTHGYVLNVHTEAFLNPHTEEVVANSAYQEKLTYSSHLATQRFTKETLRSFTFSV